MRRLIRLSPILLSLILIGCATAQQDRAVTVAVSVHAVIATIDDTEWSLFKSGTIPQPVHLQANTAIVAALEAGKTFDAAVRAGTGTKASLQDVTNALAALAQRVATFVPGKAQAKLQAGIIAAQQAILLATALLL